MQDARMPFTLLTGVVGMVRDMNKAELRDSLIVPFLQPKQVVAAANALISDPSEMPF